METFEKEGNFYKNKDLALPYEKFCEDIKNDFIPIDNWEAKLEWAMLITQGKFKQTAVSDIRNEVKINSFDKSILLLDKIASNGFSFYRPLTSMQANPSIFPFINLKWLSIQDTIQFLKIKELQASEKRHIYHNHKRVYELSHSFFKKDTESFYSTQNGYQLNDSFFEIGNLEEGRLEQKHLPKPIILKQEYMYVDNVLKYVDVESYVDEIKSILIAYQLAFSMYYEWSIYIKEYDNIGFVIPIDPLILKEFYETSLLKTVDKKRMIHFVRDYYRRRRALPNEDYSIYVKKYLRGEHKFEYRGFRVDIIPPKYDLNRVQTKKKFIDIHS